jgi:hypothetical protein
MNVGNFSNIPLELRLLPNWIMWRLEYPNGLDKKPTKVPYQINGFKASVSNPSHWVTFDIAFKHIGDYSGLGFVFTNSNYAGIDLDDASTLHTGEANPNYQSDLNRQIKIAHEFDSYSEVSPSGKGLHIIVKGSVPDGKRTNFIELYSSDRFFTMTGNVHNNKPIGDYQDLLTQLWSQMGGVVNPQPTVDNTIETTTDEEIIALAFKHNTETFTRLYNADLSGYPSQSEADLAFMNIVAYYTNSKQQVTRIYSKSRLAQTDKKRQTVRYQQLTVNRAFDLKLPNVNIEGMKEALEAKLAVSVNGKPAAFDAANIGSSPVAATNLELPPGLMGDITSFVYASSPRPVQEVSLAAAIGLMAGICGRAYNISGTGLNQYVLLLAMTGAGKEAMAEGIDRLMSEIKMQVPTSTTFIGPSEISSGSALFKYLGNTSQSFVSLLGEFGLRIKQLSAINANGAEVSLRRMILDLYNKSGHNRTLAASAYSKKEDSTHSVPSPSFSILGESTPERFYEVLNEDMISEGLLPRFLLLEYKGGRVPNNESRALITPTISLIERLASLCAHCETINHSNPRRVVNVQADDQASKFLYDFDKLSDAKINSADKDVIRQLWNRAHIKVLKLSALVAVGVNMLEPIIDIKIVNWAADLVKNDIATLTARFEAGEIGGNTSEINQAKDMIRILIDYAQKDFAYVSKYHAVEKMHKDKVVSNTYLSLRLSKIASFRTDRNGATVALKRTLQNMIDNGKLIPLSPIELVKKYSTTQKAFYIDQSILE